MFSGIVEAQSPILKIQNLQQAVRIWVQRPAHFDDLKSGDSIACNGVCLTVESFDADSMQFTLALETLNVLRLQPESLVGTRVNLERSLRFGDRVHGHLVTGHVEGLGKVLKNEAYGDSWLLDIELPANLMKWVWKKGSLTVHGVSLTVNEVHGSHVSLCLIPETVQRTNLAQFAVGHLLNIETDYLAKALLQSRQYEI